MQASVTDPDPGDTHSFAVTTQGTLGTASVDDTGLVTYVAANAAGNDTVAITVTDAGGLTAMQTIAVTITASEAAANQAPSISSDDLTLVANTTGTVQVSVTDPDPGDTHSFAVTTQGTLGTAHENWLLRTAGRAGIYQSTRSPPRRWLMRRAPTTSSKTSS